MLPTIFLCGEDGKINPSTPNFDMAKLPPCHDCLAQHINRTNYQVAIWKCAEHGLLEIPDPTDGHGWYIVYGLMEPLWTERNIVPLHLESDLEEVMDESGSDDDSDNDMVYTESIAFDSDDDDSDE